MEERSPQDFKKLIIVFAVGIPLLGIELFRMLFSSGPEAGPQKNIIEATTPLTIEQRIDTNPKLSWFEKNFCRGYKRSSFCKYFGETVHPKH